MKIYMYTVYDYWYCDCLKNDVNSLRNVQWFLEMDEKIIIQQQESAYLSFLNAFL